LSSTSSGGGARSPGDRGPVDESGAPPRVHPLITQGRVLEVLPHAMYAVELSNGKRVLSRVSGDIRTRGMRLVPGDCVTLELSPYDLGRGRITKKQR
jgi:translation initiation factor IF-1